MHSAIAKTWSRVAVGRSSALSWPGTFDATRITSNEVVVNRRNKDGVKNSIGLGDGRLADARLDPLQTPRANALRVDLIESEAAQLRADM
jgi:hypothetical protein